MVELPRVVGFGARGLDVEAHVRALHRFLGSGGLRGFQRRPVRVRRFFGWGKVRLAKRAAGVAGLPRLGVVGPELFARLWEAGAYDAFARRLLAEHVERVRRARDPRVRVVLAARRRFERRGLIAYSQARPMLFREPPGVESALDCSAFVTACYREAGLPDPNGYVPGYPGWGFTGTLWRSGRPIGVSQLQPGDLIFYGVPWLAGGAAHVVVYRGGGRAYSMGSSAGPSDVAFDYRPIVGCRSYRLK